MWSARYSKGVCSIDKMNCEIVLMNLVPIAKLEQSAWNKTAFLLPRGVHVLSTCNGNEMVDDTASEALLDETGLLFAVLIFLWEFFCFEEQN